MTRDDLAWGAGAALARERPAQPDPLDELAERTSCRWGRHHTDAVRAALYRTLADLADVLLEVSESTPTPLDWTADDDGWRASAGNGGVVHDAVVQKAEHAPSGAQPVWHHPSPPAAGTAW
ncbi:hypothetical protein ABZT17_44905 [Streptomyces sp. NPDC005648]|uniref:hypothetical protein n=1 Tax=Streptomyces sp. NPDC005648 TaxID=3157044 RepID=UPI0033A38865